MPHARDQRTDRKKMVSFVPSSRGGLTPRLPRRAAQAVIEYAFLLIILATITIGVVFLAGDQLGLAFNDFSYDVGHVGDLAPITVSPHPCTDGTVAVFRHNKWRCKNE
jgi:hypothetical protein